ncbi:WHG domain-containing protein [Nocardia puris]|uniref:TetR family transcriptional regulator n=1 Tax=Nocardia puris TaxID=208602 RepID=A0A366DHE8_9NOCA|nr:TetR/AcrR family transcriptional regulator [Nocardia puris]MBF6213324.1 WHG domain-containing protein [Nocardia puris]MBF6369508.1 WHG domain-containing protein [Nocardia puris]MBF6462203.1 WHG domain-containing protein [Nocardia puris]RBO89510.1 TetR family transcriptional regulator [Nocardia puris]
MVEVKNRRERLRAEATREIKDIGLRLLAEGGPDAITLRAIAREMGMTAGALYGYFATRDDLITTLIADVYAGLVDRLEAARDAVPEADPAGRIVAWGEQVRVWAVAHPAEFRLIYGDPVPGYHPPPGGPAREAELRACEGLVGLAAAAWPTAAATQTLGDPRWTDFDESLAEHVREAFPGLPPAGLALALRMWGRMHGLVALEVYGHLTPQSQDPAKLFRAEMLDLVRGMGL